MLLFDLFHSWRALKKKINWAICERDSWEKKFTLMHTGTGKPTSLGVSLTLHVGFFCGRKDDLVTQDLKQQLAPGWKTWFWNTFFKCSKNGILFLIDNFSRSRFSSVSCWKLAKSQGFWEIKLTFHITSHQIAWHHMTLHHMFDITSHHSIPHHTSHHIISHHIITPHQITSHNMVHLDFVFRYYHFSPPICITSLFQPLFPGALTALQLFDDDQAPAHHTLRPLWGVWRGRCKKLHHSTQNIAHVTSHTSLHITYSTSLDITYIITLHHFTSFASLHITSHHMTSQLFVSLHITPLSPKSVHDVFLWLEKFEDSS
jgi:hypothetical protein